MNDLFGHRKCLEACCGTLITVNLQHWQVRHLEAQMHAPLFSVRPEVSATHVADHHRHQVEAQGRINSRRSESDVRLRMAYAQAMNLINGLGLLRGIATVLQG